MNGQELSSMSCREGMAERENQGPIPSSCLVRVDHSALAIRTRGKASEDDGSAHEQKHPGAQANSLS